MPKAKISRSQIIQTSLATLAECRTLDQFSMRKVAATLKVDASTLYWHFENKQALLQAMADEIASQITFPDNQRDWQTQLTQLFRTIFAVYTAHPHAAELMLETIPASKTRLTLMDHIMAILVTAGFSETEANEAMTTIDFFLTGLIIDLTREQQFRSEINSKQAAYLHDQVQKMHQITHDAKLNHMQAAVQFRNTYTAKQQFEVGLKLIINGLLASKS
ncbi:TetR/AcrR family transcriptional regulator [Pediococcus siamensis]|uniref:TetR/AcrR family transcriptional regulator n=1 Tax=Pediococcus siamensis TaxID=381829 RepID=UPI0039A1CFB1